MSAPSDVAAAGRAIEEAALAFLNASTPEQRSAAERWLLEARKWPNPLAVCHHVLVHSATGYAKLQALYMIRECLGAQWAALSPAERTELQMLLLRLQTDASTEQYVRAAAAQLLAVVPDDLLDLGRRERVVLRRLGDGGPADLRGQPHAAARAVPEEGAALEDLDRARAPRRALRCAPVRTGGR